MIDKRKLVGAVLAASLVVLPAAVREHAVKTATRSVHGKQVQS